MKSLTSLSALLLAGSLVACGDRNEEPAPEPEKAPASERAADANADWQASIATLQGLAEEAFSLEDALEADLGPINEALPDLVSVSWDEQSFDERTGATVFSGLTVTINSDPEFGMEAGEAEVWGLNSDLIAARLRGERLDETGLAFNRLEVRDVSYFGVGGALNTLFDAMEEQIEEDAGEDVSFGVETFDSTTAEMVFSNVSLRPFELVPVSDTFFTDLTPDEDPEEMTEEEREQMALATDLVRLAQKVVAISRSFSIEDLAAYDTVAVFAMDQQGMKQNVEVSWDFYGYEDMDGFDLGRAVIVNTVQSQSMDMTDPSDEMEEAGFEGFSLKQVEKTAFISYQDIKLDKLAGYLVRSEFPTMDERDLMSLGTWEARDYSLTFNDGDVFEADRVAIDADSFAWFIPEDFGLDISGAKIDVQDVGEVALAFIPEEAIEEIAEDPAEDSGTEAPEADDMETPEEEAADFKANLQAAVDKLDEHGLEAIPFDISTRWQWGADSGETGLTLDTSSEGFGEGAMSIDVTLPDYAALQAAFNAEDREAAFEDAFKEAFAFGGARFYEADDGGYDKLFGYVSEVAKLYPDQGWGATLGGMEPQQMRSLIATMVRSGKQAAAQQFPPAADWLESVALYYETSGGSLEIKAEPPTPLTPDDFEQLGPDTAPEQIVEDLGLSVTQTAE
ncbi:hypothetical protein [Henriciella sp.]|uniref:hypothetical protein n=1 Tax=Henriciella sp. TaxID=1968823 RepID=UPI00260BBDDD|nr:hypothetical protein [Henriciella sp.]